MSKLIIFGASGFVGRALTPLLDKQGVKYVAPASKELDLSALGAAQKIADIVQDGDCIIMLSAYTPEKGPAGEMTIKNIMMMEHLLTGIKGRAIEHFIYISSDAVYPLTADMVDEHTPTCPPSLYGQMHVMREQFVREYFTPEKLTILRPCAIYGEGDTHNAYGINRFILGAEKQNEIVLFGGGEEYRDHIHVDDFAAIIFAAWQQKITGIFNAASGKSWRFIEIAHYIKSSLGKNITITLKPRAMPIFHRHVDNSKLCVAFSSCQPRTIDAGIRQLLKLRAAA